MITTEGQIIAPGQRWAGRHQAHPWLIEVKRLSLQSVTLHTVAKGARGHSRVRGGCELQRMNRAKFLAQFVIVHDRGGRP